MKQKIIAIVLTLVIVLGAVLIAPEVINPNYNTFKEWTLLGGGLILLILICWDYKNIKLDKKDIIVLIFLGLVTISTILSSNLKVSIWGMNNRYEGLLAFYSYGIIYFTAKRHFKYENKKELLNILFYAGVLICAIGIMQKYVNNNKKALDFLLKYINIYRLTPILRKTVNGTFGNSNFFGSFIAITLPITSYLFIVKKSKKAGFLSLLLFFNMLACTARSSWVAFIIGFIFFLIFIIVQRNKKYFIRALILFLLFGIIGAYFFGGFTYLKTKIKDIIPKKEEQTQNVVQNKTKVKKAPPTEAQRKVTLIQKEIKDVTETGSVTKLGSGRILIWKMCIKLIKQKPFFGCGTDNLLDGLHKYCNEEITEFIILRKSDVDKAHNEYLQIAATNGMPALLAYLTFLSLIVFPKMRKMFKEEKVFVFTIAIICYLAQAFFNISTIGVAPILWLVLGLSENKEIIEEAK